ncbi:hypothetical protein AB0E83_14765 [Streptomyces sp. NPDC035033]|uniref:hypothetical protein n=1 Tax=Streptomyces sp. NPDC035033 TaxID=3155368 RepID=UPI0033DDF71E
MGGQERRADRAASDLAVVTAWWRGLDRDGFLALPPPGRARYDQGDGHADAAELAAGRGLTGPVSFAYWHWQSHTRAFDRSGALTGELLLHWGGDHATVAAGLGPGPDGFRITDNGPRGAFGLDRVTGRDADGLPDPADPDGVRQFLAGLGEPLDRGAPVLRYRPLSAAEAAWLHARLAGPLDLASATPFADALERRDALTPDETRRLLRAWRERHPDRPAEWTGHRNLLHALLRHGHEEAWEAVAALGPGAAGVLASVPSERALATVRGFALAGDRAAVHAWLRLHRALREPGAVPAAAALAADLAAHDAPEGSLRGLYDALAGALTTDWREETGSGHHPGRSYTALTAVRLATDERLPRPLRVLAAAAADEQAERVREQALGGPEGALPAVRPADALAAVTRFEAARDDLLAGTGPDLTAPEGALGDLWHRHRTLTDAGVRWLRERIADPATGLQGLGFCLELLLAHGLGTAAEVDALLPRRMKDLAKKYRTTYTEWRHPLVTLTCLALDLGHPAAGRLVAWWEKERPVWKDELRLLTHLGAPDEAKAAELWEFAVSGAHDVGQLLTWVLVRARLDGVHPLLVADRLLRVPGPRPYVVHRVLLAAADPAQPLWHYDVDRRSRSWWQRAVEVAEHPGLSAEARAIGLRAARGHYLLTHPDRVVPLPTGAERAAALRWAEGRPAAGTP